MGIQGLLPLLKSTMVPVHIKDLEGCCVAVDTYSWLHKGALSCSVELCKGLATSRHINYCLHRVNLLRHYGIKPIMVFDGGFLPMKVEQENKRARARKENLVRAIEHEAIGNSKTAYECYQKAVDISPAIAYDLIQVLQQENVSYIVAPYEADAQMTFLAVSKQVDAVITEDSDLIPFGCPRIIFKMDKHGQGVEFQYSKLHLNKELNLTGFTRQMLLEMCILSGCDYLQSLPGMGLKKAHALIRKFKSYDKAIKHLRYSTMAVPPLYEESFKKAIWTFLHQRVYDPNVEDIVHLSTLSGDVDGDLEFLGPLLSQPTAKSIATGEIDPITKLPFKVKTVCTDHALEQSYQLKDFKPEIEKKKLELPAENNVLTNYFCYASLEAKRNFKAPRVSPDDQDSLNGSSPSFVEQVSDEATAFQRDHSFESGNASSPILSTDNNVYRKDTQAFDSPSDGATESPEQDPLQQLKHSDHRPFSLLHKRLENKCASVDVTENRCFDDDNTLRSSYYSEKHIDDSDPFNKKHKVIVRSSYFQRKEIDKNGSNCKSRRAIVRSSYFQSKPAHENDPSKSMNAELGKGGTSTEGEYMNTSTGTCLVRGDNSEVSNTKRKASLVDSVCEENVVSNKQMRAELPVAGEGKDPPVDDTSQETKLEGKFGCNISHLGRYSSISEKSMEKFVSVISSFRFNSSGSRASGLRAPLKDVGNSCKNRTPAVLDISKFSYVPNGKKPVAAIRRR